MIIQKRGFALIELMVGLALVGILAAIVIAALNTSRAKGADAAAKQALSNTRQQAELLFSVSGTYEQVCTSGYSVNNVRSIYLQVFSAARAQGYSTVNTTLATPGTTNTVTCHASTNSWAAEVPLKAGGMFCVDSRGASAETANNLGAGEAQCS